MLVYHVSLNAMEDRVKLFTPRIPWATSDDEETETPRICVSPSIVGCCTGIGYDSAFESGMEILVYEANISREKLVPPQVLIEKYSVLDAMCTQEHWCLEPVTMVGHLYQVVGFERDNYILPEKRVEEQVRGYFGSDLPLHELLNVYAPEHGVDEDQLVEMFGVRGIRIFTKIKLEVADEKVKR